MHGKENVIAPLLQNELGIKTILPLGFNTDKFGTFTREISRPDNQLNTARNKAIGAMLHTGLDLVVASEGSFGQNSDIPFLSRNLELVILLDKSNNIEIIGHFINGNVRALGQAVGNTEEAIKLAYSWGFPKQGVIVRMSEKSNRLIHKVINNVEELEEICDLLLSKWFNKTIFLETDMRAHRCPLRLNSIKEATYDLIKNCQKLCPNCTAPGFVVTDNIKGLPCNYCGLPTDLAKDLIYSCQKCFHFETKLIEKNLESNQSHCDRCNP
jgi:hypothetical protein